MTCDEARARLSALLDEALGPDERGPLEAHVATCVACRRELGLLRNTVALLHSVNPERAPAGFADRVLAAARPAPWCRRLQRALSLPWSVKLPLAAAAALLVGVAVAHLLEMAPELQRAARVESPSPAVTESQEPPATPTGAPGQKAKAESEPATRERREGRARDLAGAGADAMVIELTIPRAAWSEFTRELAALGAWTPDREPAELPAQVRVALRITE